MPSKISSCAPVVAMRGSGLHVTMMYLLQPRADITKRRLSVACGGGARNNQEWTSLYSSKVAK